MVSVYRSHTYMFINGLKIEIECSLTPQIASLEAVGGDLETNFTSAEVENLTRKLTFCGL